MLRSCISCNPFNPRLRSLVFIDFTRTAVTWKVRKVQPMDTMVDTCNCTLGRKLIHSELPLCRFTDGRLWIDINPRFLTFKTEFSVESYYTHNCLPLSSLTNRIFWIEIYLRFLPFYEEWILHRKLLQSQLPLCHVKDVTQWTEVNLGFFPYFQENSC